MRRPFAAGVAVGAAAASGAALAVALVLHRRRDRRRLKEAGGESSSDSPRKAATVPVGRAVSDSTAWWRGGERLLAAGGADVIFLGSGSSSGLPQLECLLPLCPATEEPAEGVAAYATFPAQVNPDGRTIHCEECALAREAASLPVLRGPSPYRGNPSLLIRFEGADGARRHVMIDCGKTFREAARQWFPYYGVPGLDAVILTHEHADSIFGLDDLRSVQKKVPGAEIVPGKLKPYQPIQMFCSQHTMNTVSRVVPYLVSKQEGCQPCGPACAPPPGPEVVVRYVANLQWNIIEPYEEFEAAGLRVLPLPVMHGEDYPHMLAFVFGGQVPAPTTPATSSAAGNGFQSPFVYMSDVSRIPDRTMKVLQELPSIQTLVLDCLHLEQPHKTHASFSEAMEMVARLQPEKAFFVGCAHDMRHDEGFQELIEAARAKDPRLQGTAVRLAFDGLELPLRL